MPVIEIYDTIRDASQDPDLDLSLRDKLRLAKVSDSIGIDYLEMGWPFSNATDRGVFGPVRDLRLNARVAAFGSTIRIGGSAKTDANLDAIIRTEAPVATIFGKSWLLHVYRQLSATDKQNLDAIYDSVEFLKKHHEQVVFDAEHFFDGFKDNPKYALDCLDTALAGGADRLVLCDTNGGTYTWEIRDAIQKVLDYFVWKGKVAKLGIHCHNDRGIGVANTLEFANFSRDPRYEPYIVQVQGTLGGFGERIGNADLVQIICNLDGMGITTGVSRHLAQLEEAFNEANDVAEVRLYVNTPFVGFNAGRHKAGVHYDGISKGATYDFTDLSRYGHRAAPMLSNQSGAANMVLLAASLGYQVDKRDPRIVSILTEFKQMNDAGYHNGALPAEQYLLVERHLGNLPDYFGVIHHKVVTEDCVSTCELEGRVNGDGKKIVRSGRKGPVDVTYLALQDLVSDHYSSIKEVELSDFWVKEIKDAEELGSAAKVRVKVEFKYRNEMGRSHYWETVGVSDNIIDASREAIEKGFRYHLLRQARSTGT